MKVTFTRRPNSNISNFNFLTKASKANRLDESVILSEGIFKSVADAFRLGDLGDKLSEYAEKNKSVLKLKIKDIEEKLKQDGIDVKAIKAYENMYVKDVMNRQEDGTFSAMIQNIIDNCNKNTEHPIARKTVCYIIIFSLLILINMLNGFAMFLPLVTRIVAVIMLISIGSGISIKAIDGCVKQNGTTIIGATLITTLLGSFIAFVKVISGGSLLSVINAAGSVLTISIVIISALFVWLIRRHYKQKYGEDVISSKEKDRMFTVLTFLNIPAAIIRYFDSTTKFFIKYKSFDSEKIDETVFGNQRTTTYKRTIREAKSYSVGSAKKKARKKVAMKKARSKKSLRGQM